MHYTQRNKKSILIVYVSLFLSMVLFSGSTFAWFIARDTATIVSDELEMNASAGLRVNEGEEISNVISLDNLCLSEVSSVDGRNMFLPVSGNYTSETAEMIFREASVGDQNEYFAYKNFTLTGDSELTQIYVKSYNIEVTDTNGTTYKYNGGTEINYDENKKPVSQVPKVECPVRIAFISDSADSPIVIDPTALVDEHVTNYHAINTISADGRASVQKTDYTSFSNHYFSYNDPLFELFGSESKNVTMVVWLECTSSTAVCDKFANATVSVDVELESNFSDTEIIYFVDETIGDSDNSGVYQWINPDDSCIVTMAYYDENDNTTKTVVMNAISNTKWYAPIPKGITTNIYFYRYSLTDEVIYNAWYTSPNVNSAISSTVDGWLDAYSSHGGALQTDRGTGTTYTALRGNGYGDVDENDSQLQLKRLSPCIGFWDYESDNTGGGGDDSGGGGNDSGNTGGNISIGIAVNIPDGKAWISDNLKNGYKMYAIISTDGVEKAHELTTNTNDYKRCETKNLMLQKGAILKRFELRSSYGDTKSLSIASGNITLDKSWNYTFEINNSDKAEQR